MWVELHDTVREHRKTWIFAEALEITNAHAVGLLACLWSWAITHATDGNLNGFPPRAIAHVSGWEGDADVFLSALEKSHYLESGLIHDWCDYAGRLNEQRAKNAARMREARARKLQEASTEQNRHDLGTVYQQDLFVLDTCAAHTGATEPNLTVPNLTVSNQTKTDKRESSIVPVKTKGHRVLKPPVESAEFQKFWEAYPRKEAKVDALNAFFRLNPNKDLIEIMLGVIKEQENCAQWRNDDGLFIPLPATWINNRRWEDEVNIE